MKSDIKTILKEPFVDLGIKKTKSLEVLYNQTFRQKQKMSFFQKTFDFLYGNNINGSYFEFGCHRARTFRFALRESIIKNMNMDFYAFDSFQGLPDHKNNFKQNAWHLKGLLKTELKYFEKLIFKYRKLRKIEIIKGFYDESLTLELKKKFQKKKINTSFINIDCDLEISVKESLDFALNFIVNGTVLYIDDYYTTYKGDTRKGIPTIVSKLIKKHKLHFEPWHLIGGFGKSFLLYK
jgi:hypothetical protein